MMHFLHMGWLHYNSFFAQGKDTFAVLKGGKTILLDEIAEKYVDMLCESVPRFLNPWIVRLSSGGLGWRIRLYTGAAFRKISAMLGHISNEDNVNQLMEQTAARGQEQMEKLSGLPAILRAALQRADDRSLHLRFAALLFLLMLSVCGVVTGHSAAMPLVLCLLWLAEGMEHDYPPVCGGVRQRYLCAMFLRTFAYGVLMVVFFAGYARYGLPINVILQSAMAVTLTLHFALFLSLVAFNKRQKGFLRALAGVLGVIPALMAASALALAASMLAQTLPLVIGGIAAAVGALLLFFAQELEMIAALGGVRIPYHRFSGSLMLLLGLALLLTGAWVGAF